MSSFRDERKHHANYPSVIGEFRECYYFDGVTVRTHYLRHEDLREAFEAGLIYVQAPDELTNTKSNTLEKLYAELTIVDMLSRMHGVRLQAVITFDERLSAMVLCTGLRNG